MRHYYESQRGFMKASGIALILYLFVVTAFAQNDRGIISGTITDPDGGVVAGATVQAKNAASGAAYVTTSGTTGTFTIADLPAGTYDISVPPTGFTFFPYAQKHVI